MHNRQGRIFSAGKPSGATIRAAKPVPCPASAGQKIQSTSASTRAAFCVISSGSPGPTPTPQKVPVWFMIASVMVMVVVMMMMVVSMRMRRAVLTDAANVVVMADLRLADSVFEPRQLDAVFAQFAVHIGAAVERFLDALGEDFEQQGMDVEIACTKKLRFGMPLGEFGGQTTDAFFQYASEQEKRK